MPENFRAFEAGPDPFGQTWQVEFRWIQNAISIRHADGYRINRALIEEMNVIPDFRAPDNIRLGFTPLYTSFTEIREGFDRIKRVMEEKRYDNYPQQKLTVT